MTNPAPGGVVLAAGASERMGRAKALLMFRDETFVERAVRVLREGGAEKIVVVSSAETADAIRKTLAGVPDVEVVVNPKPEGGMISSVRVGVRALGEAARAQGAIVSLVDTPEVEPWVVARLVRSARPGDVVLIPEFPDGDGHPIVLTPEGVARLDDDLPRGLKTLIDRAGAGAVRVPLGGLRPRDCDDAEAYAALVARHAGRQVRPGAPRPWLGTALSSVVLFGAASAFGLWTSEPLFRPSDAATAGFFFASAIAGCAAGVFQDRASYRTALPQAALFTALAAFRRVGYSGWEAYLVEAIAVAAVVLFHETGHTLGRILRAPPGALEEAYAAEGRLVARRILRGVAWGLALCVPAFALAGVAQGAAAYVCFAAAGAALGAVFVRSAGSLSAPWLGAIPAAAAGLSAAVRFPRAFPGQSLVLAGGAFLFAGVATLAASLAEALRGRGRL